MRLLNTNGQMYSIQPMDYVKTNNQTQGKSKGHLLARSLIKECFPIDWVLEEVPVKVGKQTLFADFLIKGRSTVVEVQGPQHYEFTPAFHETKEDFTKARARDNLKRDWCETNGFTLIELRYGEEDDWRSRLCQ